MGKPGIAMHVLGGHSPAMPLIAAIETSCDETAVAVLRGFDGVAAHEILSQAEIHSKYGGVVPEVASRNHLESVPFVFNAAMSTAGVTPADLDAIAATTGPGLATALLVGAAAAKGLAIGAGRPFLAVNHIEGHMLSPFFGRSEIPPHVGLVVSGGHTLLFDVAGFGRYKLLGRTRDDAAGEAFDKVAKLLGLGYPGGLEIDRLARSGDRRRHDFPRGMIDEPGFDFSFSGLKTAVRIFLEKNDGQLPDICASFQAAVVDVLVEKAFRALRVSGHRLLALSGGVSANAALRAAATKRAAREGVEVVFAPDGLRTDNALMIAYVAAHQLAVGRFSALDEDISPNFDAARLCA